MDSLVLFPRLSEKAYNMSQSSPVYVFVVPMDVSKQSVASSVAKQFSVDVVSVNILGSQGKAKRTYVSRRGKFVKGKRSDFRKAYVTIKAGQNIPIFAADEEAEAKAEKQTKQIEKVMEKADKKAEKKAAKESK